MEIHLAVDVPSPSGAMLVDVHDGDTVTVEPPPQGGFVVFAGARVNNLDPCGATISAQFVNPQTGAQIGDLDKRPVDFAPDGSGLLVPTQLDSFSRVSNVPACGFGTPHVFGQPVALQVTVTDRGMRTGTTSAKVSLACPDNCAAQCMCICPPLDQGVCVDGGSCVR
jgi:hypothetical protein